MVKRKKKQQLLPSSSIVTQANKLVSARYVLPLSEQRLVLTMIAKIQPEDEDFKPYKISIAKLADFLGVDQNSAYRECKKITKKLLSRVLEIQEPGGLLQTNWVSSASYIDGSGMVNLSFDPLLKPYLLQLKGNFTSCKLQMLLSFKSQYTMRMYMVLKQYARFQEYEIELEQLRDMLGLRKDQHKEYHDFKKNILKPVQNELAEKADLYFECEEVKYGRRVGAIYLRILKQNRNLPQEPIPDAIPTTDPIDTQPQRQEPTHLELLLALVPAEHRAKKTVRTALETFEYKHGFDYVKRNILYSNEKAAKSYAGFLNNALKDDWGHDWELDTQIKAKQKPLEIWERQGFATEKEYSLFMFQQQMERYHNKSAKKPN